MDNFITWSETSTIHGVANSLYVTRSRGSSSRKLWRVLVLTFMLTCLYFQSKLIWEIFVDRPTVVDVQLRYPDQIKFPNVVICDMNQDLYRFLEISSAIKDIGILALIFIQLSWFDLYVPLRHLARKNVSEMIERYPLLEDQYEEYYKTADPNLLYIFSKTIFIWPYSPWVRV